MGAVSDACKMSLLLLSLALAIQMCHSTDLQRVYSQRGGAGPNEEVLMLPKKRPFCNAFTGCGRKRSPPAVPGVPLPEILRQRQLADEEVFSNALDAEDPTQELTRQLLSEARMLEAMQEANQEMYRRKQMGYPLSYNLQ